MSEDREDANWDTAQRTHRDIQEEILHSRNLELFEDVERLLPVGPLPACVEELMPVDPWDPGDQKAKRKLPSAKNVDAEPARKKQRGHSIPEGGHEGFKSVAELLRDSGKLSGSKTPSKGKGNQTESRKRAATPSQSESDEEAEDLDLLYGHIKTTKGKGKSTGKVKKAGPRGAVRGKVKGKDEAVTEVMPTQRETSVDMFDEEERRRKSQRDELNRSALDFFQAEGPIRQQQHTPPLATPPSSPPDKGKRPVRPTLSPETDESPPMAQKSPPGMSPVAAAVKDAVGRLTPRTAAAAGFSQIGPIDLSFDEDGIDIEDTPENSVRQISSAATSNPAPSSSRQSETLAPHPRSRIMGISRPRRTQTKSIDMMPPPPVPPPSHGSSSPRIPVSTFEATQAIRGPGGRRRPAQVVPSSGLRPGPTKLSVDDSPMLPPDRVRRPHAGISSPLNSMARGDGVRGSSPTDEVSSPIRPQRRLPRRRAPAEQVKGYVSYHSLPVYPAWLISILSSIWMSRCLDQSPRTSHPQTRRLNLTAFSPAGTSSQLKPQRDIINEPSTLPDCPLRPPQKLVSNSRPKEINTHS